MTRQAVAAALLLASLQATVGAAQAQAGGLEITLDRAGPDIFPASWLPPPISASAELPAEQAQRCGSIVKRALAKYPAAVLSKHLKKIYGLGRLEYSGVSTGGTNSRSAVYLVCKEAYSDNAVENNFHAEFSSILFRNRADDFDKEAWQQVNPPDFRYRGSGVQAIKNKQATVRLAEALHDEGFLNEYGKASMEEDFNSYAARLLMGDAVLWGVMEKHPKVQAKAALVMAFYQKLDAHFTPAFFQSLRK